MRDRESKSGAMYFELSGRPDAILRFDGPDASAMSVLREVLQSLPVRHFIPDKSGVDPWEAASIVGKLDEVLNKLTSDLNRDRAETARTLDPNVRAELLFTESDIHRDALHVVTRLSPRGRSDESISYGARLQRIDADRYALWSDY